MTVSIQLTDKLAEQLHLDGPESSRRVLESVAIQGYRSGELSGGQVGELLGISFWETEALLKEHGCMLDFDIEEHDRSLRLLKERLGR